MAWGFSLRSDVEGAPKIVLDFLYNTWALVIAHAQLTDTRGQLDPGGYLAVVTDLLWSVNHEAAMRQPAHLFEIVPHIVQTLRRGLEMLGHDPKDSNRFFDALMRYGFTLSRMCAKIPRKVKQLDRILRNKRKEYTKESFHTDEISSLAPELSATFSLLSV